MSLLSSWGKMGLCLLDRTLQMISSAVQAHSMAVFLLFKLETSCSTWCCRERDLRDQIHPSASANLPKTPVGTHLL